jgi:hypothetical protein
MGHPFDLFAYADGSADYLAMIEFFSRINPVKHPDFTQETRKGLLRVVP